MNSKTYRGIQLSFLSIFQDCSWFSAAFIFTISTCREILRHYAVGTVSDFN